MRISSIAVQTIAASCLVLGIALSSGGCAGSRTSRSTGAYIDDTGVSARVKSALFKDPMVSGFDVHVNTYRGDVQLSGFVDSAEQKERAASIARGVEGVKTVANNLEVKPTPTAVGTPGSNVQGTQTVTQPAPETPARDELAPNSTTRTLDLPPNRLPAFTNNVEITTSNGKATLRGTVANEGDKVSIEKKVRDIPGIQSVDNELRVLSPH